MVSKKEKLKFYRLPAPPSYSTDTPAISVRGYKNTYDEYSQYLDRYQGTVNLPDGTAAWRGPSPQKFFDVGTYQGLSQIEFVVDGQFVPYNRVIHDLDSLSSKIYILETSSTGIFGIPYDDYPSTTDVGRKPYIDVSIVKKASLKSITFHVNPTTIRIRKKKFFQKLRTRAGWAFQHWGPDIGEINLEGTTGNITPDPKIQVGKIFGIPFLPQVVEEAPTMLNSPALRAFRILEQWYDDDQNDQSQSTSVGQLIALEFRDRTYVGHFAEFNFEEKGTHPFQLFYQLKFLIHYDAGSLTSATTRASNQIIRNDETLKKILELRNASAESNLGE